MSGTRNPVCVSGVYADGTDLYLENPWHIGDGEKEGVRCLYLILLRKPY